MHHANRHANRRARRHARRHAIARTASAAAIAPVRTAPAGTAASGGWLQAWARASARRPARAAALAAAWCVGLGTLAIDAQATTASRPTPGAYAGRLCVQPLTNAGEAVAPAPFSGAAQGAAQGAAPGGDGASASGTSPSAPTAAPPTAPPTPAGNCGPVELTLQPGNRASVRFSDIVYRLQLHSSQVDVVLMHGNMQIDGFTTEYDWQGSTLRFNDRDKGLSYRVHFDARPARAGRAPNP